MSFYPHFSGFYAYPVPYPNQEFYPMYIEGNMDNNQSMYAGHPNKFNKPGFNNRKISQDSGISDFSAKSRKTSTVSTVSNISVIAEDSKSDSFVGDVETPSDSACEEIVEQVEFYFSNVNITKDKFLLKHVKRNKEGYVSLKLISSFKRVKHLCKDWRQVALAIEKKSDKLEVNDLKTKVRRKEPLPEYDETTPSRTVVAMNMPIERPTIEAVAEMFRQCGDIVLVRILRPGNPIPVDVRPFVNKHPEAATKVCALVEFERTEFAHKAIRLLNNEEEEEDKMKVMEMIPPPPVKTGKKSEDKKQAASASKPPAAKAPPQRRYSQGMMQTPESATSGTGEAAQGAAPRRKYSLIHNMKFSEMSEKENTAASLNPEAPVFTMRQRRLSRPSVPSSPHPASFLIEPAFGMMHPMQPFSWMTRRFRGPMDYLAIQQSVIRQPRGPSAEKGKGFQKWCRHRMEPAAERKPGSRAVPIVAPPSSIKEEPEMEDGAGAAAPPPKIEVQPLIVNVLEESSSEDDEGNFSDQDRILESEKAR